MLSLFACYLYRNPTVTLEWYDSFVQMLDDVYNVKNGADVLILGDFNIDMLGFYPCSLAWILPLLSLDLLSSLLHRREQRQPQRH